MSEKLKNAPVFYTVAEIRFAPLDVTDLADGIARVLNWDVFGATEFGDVVMAKSKRAGCVIQPECLWFHTTDYVTHAEFFRDFLDVIGAFTSLTTVRTADAVGLRYLDALVGARDHDLFELIVPGLHGGPRHGRIYHATETLYESEIDGHASELVLRTYQTKAPIGFPEDLAPVGLNLSPLHDVGEVEHIVLDTDHRYPHAVSLESDVLSPMMESMHASLKQLFVDATTDKARDIWS